MFFNLLAEAGGASLCDKKIGLGEAAIDALLGFITVFAGIAILVFIVWAVGKLMQTASGKQNVTGAAKKEKTPKTVGQATTANAKAKENETAHGELAAAAISSPETLGVDEQTVAVISAAIAAVYSGSGRNCGFVVKRIRRM